MSFRCLPSAWYFQSLAGSTDLLPVNTPRRLQALQLIATPADSPLLTAGKQFNTRHREMIRSYRGITPTVPASCYVDESAQLIGDVVLGENSSIWMNAVVRGDVHSIRIGANSNIQDCSVLHGMLNKWPVIVGDWVTVGHTVTLHGCVVEDQCLIGMGVIILNGARIGAGSIIAAGTLIPEGTIVEPRSLWMGVPGKMRKQLNDEDQQTILRYGRNYQGYREQYLEEVKNWKNGS
jgi:carbonic anhydrase/acetyltransferase-like protein (isoleucine patch superfamily)